MTRLQIKWLFFSVYLIFMSMVSFGQDAYRADSLKQIYFSDESRRTTKRAGKMRLTRLA